MSKMFGILSGTDITRRTNQLEDALGNNGLKKTDRLGPSTFLAVSNDFSMTRDKIGTSESFLIQSQFSSGPQSPVSITGHGVDPAAINGSFTYLEIASDGRQRLAIDRFGQHRVTYTQIPSGDVVFASHIDLLRYHPEVDFQLDNQAIYNYLFFHVVPSPGSIYQGIYKLPPAHRLEFDGTRVSVTRYWVPQFADRLAEPLTRKKEAVVPTVINAVKNCGVGTDTGAFLSGGLDSSTVCGALQSLRPKPAKVFSVGFAAEGYDEIEFATAAARHFGLDHNVHYITPKEVSSAVPRVAKTYDEPFGNSSAVPTLVCAEFAKSNGVSRLLAGDGGDEIFTGNARYQKQKIFELYFAIPKVLRSSLIEPLFASRGKSSPLGRGPLRKITRYVDQALIPLPDRLETHNLLQMVKLAEVLEPDFMTSINAGEPFEMMRHEWKALGDAHYQDNMLYLDWKLTLADNDLRKVSEMTNLAGVEVCYPLLDNDVVNLATSIPAGVRMPGLRLRHFFRESVRAFLPEETLAKSKHGFGLPFGEWARVDPSLREITMDALTGLRKRRILRDSFLVDVQRQHMEDHAGFYGNMIWVLMMLELWLDAHGHAA